MTNFEVGDEIQHPLQHFSDGRPYRLSGAEHLYLRYLSGHNAIYAAYDDGGKFITEVAMTRRVFNRISFEKKPEFAVGQVWRLTKADTFEIFALEEYRAHGVMTEGDHTIGHTLSFDCLREHWKLT